VIEKNIYSKLVILKPISTFLWGPNASPLNSSHNIASLIGLLSDVTHSFKKAESFKFDEDWIDDSTHELHSGDAMRPVLHNLQCIARFK